MTDEEYEALCGKLDREAADAIDACGTDRTGLEQMHQIYIRRMGSPLTGFAAARWWARLDRAEALARVESVRADSCAIMARACEAFA